MAPKRCSSRAVDIVCFEKTSKNYSGINDPCKALLTDEALAKKLFGQLAVGAQWLAKCGVVHKDLKPDNVMLTKPFLEGGWNWIAFYGHGG